MIHIRDELLRLPGISDIFIAGQRDYSMRIWVDPDKLAARNLTADDVVAALREQNAEVACGQIGQQPVPRGQETQIPLTTLGPAEESGAVRRRDPPRHARRPHYPHPRRGPRGPGGQERGPELPLQRHGVGGLIIFQLPDANALEVADRIQAKMEELSKNFPDDWTT